MSHNSDLVLEILQETGATLSKRGIEINLRKRGYEVPYETVKNQVEVLADYGLIDRAVDKGAWYELTDKGRTYLNGDLSRDELVA